MTKVMRGRSKMYSVVATTLLVLSFVGCEAQTSGQVRKPQTRGISEKSSQPNIVFILADDLGFRDIGYQGSDISTPVIDQLAASGVKLENYYVQQACSPTRSQLLTGRYQIHTGLQHGTFRTCQVDGLPLELPTMADILKRSGYSTNAVGKWHLGHSQKEYTPTYRGFDTYYGMLLAYSDHYTYNYCDRIKRCGYALYDQETPDFGGNGTYSTHAYTDRAIQIVKDSANSSKPLFLYLTYQAPHDPIQAPQVYYDKYQSIVNLERRQFAGMVSALDEGIGQLVQTLKDEGLWENTILVFSSDNGAKAAAGGSNWPLRGEKSTFWEGGLRSVGFVASPLFNAKRSGTVARGLVHVSDWLPTLAEAAGINLDDVTGLDGISQWGMISAGKQSEREEILHTINSEFKLLGSRLYDNTFDNRQQAAIRVGDYKLLTGEPGDGNWYQLPGIEGYTSPPMGKVLDWQPGSDKNIWLFNIANDPNELVDLSEEMPDKVMELLDKLAEYEAGSVPATPVVNDRGCNPANFGGVWSPWIKSD